jgi:hypothetical protein
MRSELAQVRGVRARWRFSAGCALAAVRIRTRLSVGRPAPGAAPARAVVLSGIGGAFVLVAYGLVRYPELRASANLWPSVAAFVAVLVAYAATTLALSSSGSQQAGVARRYGVAGGVVVGAAWFVIFSPTGLLKGWVAVPLAVVLFGPAAVSALAGRAARDARTATHAALWSGIVGGLVVFAVWVIASYVRDGRPYDGGLLQDFHRSGDSSLAAYAVGENLGSGLALLVLVPVVALALGSLTGRLAARPART